MNVLSLFTLSDHFPIVLDFITLKANSQNTHKKEFKLIFDENKVDEFYFLMQSIFNPVWVIFECEDLKKTLFESLYSVASSLDMKKEVRNKPFVSTHKQ